MMRTLPLLLLLSACGTTLPYNPQDMTPDAIRAAAADKNSLAACTKGNSPWGAVTTVFVQVDKAKTLEGDEITVTENCVVTVKPGKKVE